ncbi:MAG: FtsX-like permease family protein [Luteitalea sp.]|nr:FtsX-like permease family protein [Luteitalea sp.]
MRPRLSSLRLSPTRENEIVDELSQHLDDRWRELIAGGASPDEAMRLALADFREGNLLARYLAPLRQAHARAPITPGAPTRFLPTDLWRDLRYAARRLLRDRGLTLVCVLTLALVIGANTAIFSAVNAVLLRPLPYPNALRLLRVWETNPRATKWGPWASYPDFLDWQRENTVFEGMAAFRNASFRLTSGQSPEVVVGIRTAPSLFRVLQVDPILGRAFTAEEGTPGRNRVVILSYGLWLRQFGADPALIGRPVSIDDEAYVVVGIMPPGFDFPGNISTMPSGPDLWTPIAEDRDRGSHNYRVVARLKPDRTVAQARADMSRVAAVIAELDPGHRERGIDAVGLQQGVTETLRPALLVLVGAAILVLLVGCANVASLLVARGAGRQREAALGQALGAGRFRILQHSLMESFMLALIGAIAGLVVAAVSLRMFVRYGPQLPLLGEMAIDPCVLAFTLVVAGLTGLVFGTAPAVQTLKLNLHSLLKESGGRHVGSRSGSTLRHVLTVAEIALALMLLVGAGLLVRSFVQLRSVDVGFDPDKLLTAFLSAPPEAAEDPDQTVAFFQRVLERIQSLPGVQSVAAASGVPLISNETGPFRVEGREEPSAETNVLFAERPKISPGYFRTMGVRLLRGRDFTTADTRTSPPVAIVSESLVRRYWPGADPIGQRVSIDDGVWRSIVGISNDVKHDGFAMPGRATIFVPLAQFPRPMLPLLVRTDGDPAAVTAALRSAVMDVNRHQPLFRIRTMEESLGDSIALQRLLMCLLGAFAGIALVIGVAGVYGLLTYFVNQRRQEIGIRMALGACRREVVWLVLRQAAGMAIVGVAIGTVGSLALSSLLSSFLVGVNAADVLTFCIAAPLLALVVLTTSLVPARSASKVDPMIALRAD